MSGTPVADLRLLAGLPGSEVEAWIARSREEPRYEVLEARLPNGRPTALEIATEPYRLGDGSFLRCSVRLVDEPEGRPAPYWQGDLARIREILDDVQVGCQVIDREWRYLFLNKMAIRHARRPSSELLGRTMQECYPGIEQTELFASLVACMRERKAIRMDNIFTYPDGSSAAFQLTILPTREGAFVLSVDAGGRNAEDAVGATLAAITGSSSEAIIVGTIEGVITSWNSGAERIFGYTAEEMIGQSIQRLYPPNRDAELRRILDSLRRGDTVERYETVRLRKDGRLVNVSLVVSPVFDTGGKLIGASSVALDITDRKNAELVARENLARFEAITDAIDDVFWICDAETGVVHYLSPAYERIWGRSRGSAYRDPETMVDAVHPDDLEEVKRYVEFRRQRLAFDHEYRIMRPDATVRWIYERVYPSTDERSGGGICVCVAQDITERKIARDLIDEQARLLEVASDAIIVRNTDNDVTYWNPGAERIFGWKREEALGKNILRLLDPDGKASDAREAMKALLQSGEWSGELHPRSKDGRDLTVATRWTLIRDVVGKPKAFLSVSTDVTEVRSIERQLLRAQRLESLGALAGGIAHDLNNVLSPILIASDRLAQTGSDSSTGKLVDIIRSSAERGAGIVAQILGFARGMEGEHSELQMRHVLREVQAIVREAFPKSIEVTFNVPAELWPVIGDSTQLHQVLMNVCVNARDAMPEGGRLTITAANVKLDEIYARAHIDARPIRYVEVEVADTGQGMAPAVLERIFDPFFTTKPPGRGTGLGLSTAMSIVKSHGGFVNVYSELGKGSSFKIYVPAAEEVALNEGESGHEEPPSGLGELVLVVDDEEPLREVAKQILESSGYRVMTASEGTEAIAIYARESGSIDVVLVDMMMPTLDGASTIRVLRKMNPAARIIGMSGLISNAQLAAFPGGEVAAFLAKPFTTSVLLKTLREVLLSRRDERP